MTKKTTQFRQLIEAEEILIQPGIYDGFSARLVQQMGFRSASISGAGLSETNLGWADVGLMGYEENLHASRAIAACVDIPVSADGDTGYGNAVNVFFTVRGFEAAGVDGIMLEDQVWPKRCGHMEGKEVISAEEGVEKIRAAVEARRDPDFIIKARTEFDRDAWREGSHPPAEPVRRSRRRSVVRGRAAAQGRHRTGGARSVEAAFGQHGRSASARARQHRC